MPIRGIIDLNILKLVYKRLNEDSLPKYLDLKIKVNERCLRSSDELLIWLPMEANTFEGYASRLFNKPPKEIRSEKMKSKFITSCKFFY